MTTLATIPTEALVWPPFGFLPDEPLATRMAAWAQRTRTTPTMAEAE